MRATIPFPVSIGTKLKFSESSIPLEPGLHGPYSKWSMPPNAPWSGITECRLLWTGDAGRQGAPLMLRRASSV